MRLFSAFVIQVYGDERAHLLEYAVSCGHGVEVADFAFPAVVNDAAAQRRLRQWYVRHLTEQTRPVSIHAPFVDMLPASQDSLIREATMRRMQKTLDAAAEIGAAYMVVHTGFNPAIKQPGCGEAWAQRQIGFWTEALKDRTTRVLFENVWEPEPCVIAGLVDATGHLNTGVCFDVGHAHLHSRVSLAEWVDALDRRIGYMHLNDNHQNYDEELPPGDGTVNWDLLADSLAKLPAKPVAVPEVRGLAAVRKTLRFLADL